MVSPVSFCGSESGFGAARVSKRYPDSPSEVEVEVGLKLDHAISSRRGLRDGVLRPLAPLDFNRNALVAVGVLKASTPSDRSGLAVLERMKRNREGAVGAGGFRRGPEAACQLVRHALAFTAMSILLSNEQLYDYLRSLSSDLGKRGLRELSDSLLSATRQASGISTEFLGESRIALRHVLKRERGGLTDQERGDIQSILKQLDAALDKRWAEAVGAVWWSG